MQPPQRSVAHVLCCAALQQYCSHHDDAVTAVVANCIASAAFLLAAIMPWCRTS
jgi:hypothetical protein